MWRRVTKWAVIVQMIVCPLLYAVIPTVFQGWDAARRNPAWLIETAPRSVVMEVRATTADVAAGHASRAGDTFTREQVMPPVGILFERVVRTNPDDPESPKEGRGRFHAELWVMRAAGIDFTHWPKSKLVAARFFFDALFPFVLLFAVSWMTPPVPRDALDRFFAKLHTPVQPTPEAEDAALAASYADPRRFDGDKLFPGTHWEILRPARSDYIGFFGTWALVGVVVLLLWGMVTIR
jgi:SSS family solute:Na+ symporter